LTLEPEQIKRQTWSNILLLDYLPYFPHFPSTLTIQFDLQDNAIELATFPP
jgi:hypothetical protein